MNPGIAIGVGSAVVIAGIVWLITSRGALDYVAKVAHDRSKRFLHILGAHTVQPEDGDSFTTWHHYLLDVDTLAFVRGGGQRAESPDLLDTFVRESVGVLSRALVTPLAILGDGEASDDIGMPIVDRGRLVPDTAPPGPPPDDALVFWRQPGERFDVELRRSGATVGRWRLGGDPNAFRHVMRLARDRIALFYLREVWGPRIGAGLAIIDLTAGTLDDRGFIRMRQPRR